jgi:predicted transcriptional regulator
VEFEPKPAKEDWALRSAATIVAAYLRAHKTPVDDVPALLRAVHATLARLGAGPPATAPRVSVKRSITEEYLICLEDGRKLKSLRRHLWAVYGLSPEAYRKKWALPDDYPMVAPGYSRARSALAKATGLGKAGGAKPLRSNGLDPTDM